MYNLRQNKKGDLLGNVFVVIITLIVFFALYPAVKALIDVAIAANAGTDPTVDFMIGLLKWILNTTVNGTE